MQKCVTRALSFWQSQAIFDFVTVFSFIATSASSKQHLHVSNHRHQYDASYNVPANITLPAIQVGFVGISIALGFDVGILSNKY